MIEPRRAGSGACATASSSRAACTRTAARRWPRRGFDPVLAPAPPSLSPQHQQIVEIPVNTPGSLRRARCRAIADRTAKTSTAWRRSRPRRDRQAEPGRQIIPPKAARGSARRSRRRGARRRRARCRKPHRQRLPAAGSGCRDRPTGPVLAAFDEQIRRRPEPDTPDGHVEHDGNVIRSIGGGDGWTRRDLVRPGRRRRRRRHRRADQPVRELWRARGSGSTTPTTGPPTCPSGCSRPGSRASRPRPCSSPRSQTWRSTCRRLPGVELRAVVDEQGVEALVSVHDEVFGEDHSALGRALLAGLARQPAAPRPSSPGRRDADRRRARGVPRRHRLRQPVGRWHLAALARPWRVPLARRPPGGAGAARGFRYLQVDASPDSRPILERLGFVELATTTPFTHRVEG